MGGVEGGLFRDAPCGYLIADERWRITAANRTFLTWTGYEPVDVTGVAFQELLPMGDRLLHATRSVPQMQLAGAVSEVSLEILDARGERRAALLTATRGAGDDGSPEIRIIVFSAHERRQYELELVTALRRAEESEARSARAEAGLQHLALHDPLTGLPNRAGLATILDRELAGRREGAEIAALFVDLDHFKSVNDSLGHNAGDELLTVVAQRLTAAVRSSGTVARLAGDEFVVLEHVEALADATALADRLLATLNAPLVIEGLEIVCSASIGIALSDGECGDPSRLLRQADIAMYRAKARGRNAWDVHDPAEVDPAVDRMRLLGELRHAIEAGQLLVHYQPRMDMATGAISGVEALVRWQHPTRGLLHPVDFIDLAEESGLIRGLGAWVLDEALDQGGRWHRAGPDHAPVEIAVNLSARQLVDPRLTEMIADALIRHGFDPRLLTLEITETALMENPAVALKVLTALKVLGVGLAIDDFGTGYASLTYLKDFPIDELKIDRSFVSGLGSNAGDCAIVSSCIQLAHAVGIRAVAEGVETDYQRSALLTMGCDLAQGYHYSRPLAPDRITEWITAHAPAIAGYQAG
ncbi:EAL domain-containing protein [Arthrobacter agilis]|uniref:putative bifunctional diguanylate cyclase/phosphodiesterase n=1 Tax=Arthrobacter agilis TaxID=37921 RepID=UPI002365E497|nr:EAL domain-containing protein [Arthrobacter agilis]WDF33518.1 EAL domain-containing protein [Arthrobacter agilis]